MSEDHSLSYSIIAGLGATIGAILTSAILVVVELVAALLVYFYLAIYDREWFGQLVGIARHVLDFCIAQLEYWLPDFSNAANATLIGELAPKSMLLLLIGLIVGAAIRFTLWMLSRLLRLLA